MNKRQKGKQLEEFVANELKSVDKYSRPSKASGGSTEICDVLNKRFFIECKNWDKENIIMKRKDWLKLNSKMPMGTLKIPLYIFQNKYNEKFVILQLEDFVRLL